MSAQKQLFKLMNALGTSRSLLGPRPLIIACQPNAGLKHATRDKIKDLNIPDKPKKPLGPYMRYFGENISALREKNPDMKLVDIAKKCSEEWKVCDAEQKMKYRERYKTELEAYSKRFLEFQSKLTDEQRTALVELSREKSDDKKKRKIRKLNKSTNKPKKPATSFMLFAMDHAKENNLKLMTAFTSVKGKWAELPEAEKNRYEKQYLEAKAKYDKDILEWEAKMIEQGNEKVVRNSTLNATKHTRLTKTKSETTAKKSLQRRSVKTKVEEPKKQH